MDDFATLIDEHKDLPEEDQKKAGEAIAGDMGDEHKNFAKLLVKMLQEKEIDAFAPQTFLNQPVYDALDSELKAKVDLAMLNMADFVRHIADFFLSKKTPDESPQLQTMIEQLWQMKERIEKECGDVFKF